MNTIQIYEEFRDSLGEPAARALAHRLGAMFNELRDAVTKEDFRGLRESIDADVSRLDSAGGEEKRESVSRGPGPGRPCGMTRGPTGYHFSGGRHIVS